MHEQTVEDQHLTLTAAAKLAPGRPSANCVWRWCRRGVLSRNGERVRLQHLRMGGQIFTTATWMEEFGRKLAEADAKYFDLCESAAEAATANVPPRRRRRHSPSQFADQRRREIEEAERELNEAGL